MLLFAVAVKRLAEVEAGGEQLEQLEELEELEQGQN